MIRKNDLLKGVRVAAPCPARWESMEGDERVRYCGSCRLHVYNLSGMDSEEAEDLLSAHEGRRLCVRYYQRRDGTVLTRDCPVGVRLLRRRLAATLLTSLALFASLAVAAERLANPNVDSEHRPSLLASAKQRLRSIEPIRVVIDWIDPPASAVSGEATHTVGKMIAPPTVMSPVSAPTTN